MNNDSGILRKLIETRVGRDSMPSNFQMAVSLDKIKIPAEAIEYALKQATDNLSMRFKRHKKDFLERADALRKTYMNTARSATFQDFKQTLGLSEIIPQTINYTSKKIYLFDPNVNIVVDRLILDDYVIYMKRALGKVHHIVMVTEDIQKGGIIPFSIKVNTSALLPNCGGSLEISKGFKFHHYCTGESGGEESTYSYEAVADRYRYLKNNLCYIGGDSPYTNYYPPYENIKDIKKLSKWAGNQKSIGKNAQIYALLKQYYEENIIGVQEEIKDDRIINLKKKRRLRNERARRAV